MISVDCAPDGGSETKKLVAFGLASFLVVCLYAPCIRFFPGSAPYLLLVVFCLLSVTAVVSLKAEITAGNSRHALYFYGVMMYALAIAVSGAIHYAALQSVSPGLILNVNGIDAGFAVRQFRACFVYYLLFPLLLLVQYYFLKRVSLLGVLRLMVAVAAFTAVVCNYQAHIDPGFLYAWPNRPQGLDVDPNALAMTLYLSLPLCIAGLVLENKLRVRLLYLLCGLLVLSAINYSESRTFTFGAAGFVLLMPLLCALTMTHWSRISRGLCATVTVLFIVLSLSFPASLAKAMYSLGNGGVRIGYTYGKFVSAGLGGVLNSNELRGKHFSLALLLIEKSPLAGWGPAGYYIEAPNVLFQQTGERDDAVSDSALNHYLMLAGDFGLPVLGLNILIIIFPLFTGFLVARRLRQPSHKFLVAMLLASQCLFLLLINTIPPSYFLSSIWVWTGELMILLVIARKLHVLNAADIPRRVMKSVYLAMSVVLLLAAAGNYFMSQEGTYSYKLRASHPWWIHPS